jgi:hypothetical protein
MQSALSWTRIGSQPRAVWSHWPISFAAEAGRTIGAPHCGFFAVPTRLLSVTLQERTPERSLRVTFETPYPADGSAAISQRVAAEIVD